MTVEASIGYSQSGLSYESNEVISLNSSTPNWLLEIVSKLKSLGALSSNWDGRGTHGIQNQAVIVGLKILAELPYGIPRPNVVPVSGGGIQIEWQCNKKEVELEISSDGRRVYVMKARYLQDEPLEETSIEMIGDSIPANLISAAKWIASV